MGGEFNAIVDIISTKKTDLTKTRGTVGKRLTIVRARFSTIGVIMVDKRQQIDGKVT